MSQPRELRALVPVEIAALLAIAIAPLPDSLPIALPLCVVATLSRWVRGRSWAEVSTGPYASLAAIGAAVGAVALALAVVLGTPVVETIAARAVEWSTMPVVRGSATAFTMVAVHTLATAVAFELALRGWIVERVLELSPGPALLPIAAGGLAEALLTPGPPAARLGAAVFGAGLGVLYVAGGRSVVAPVCARLAYAVGALSLEALRVVG